MGILQVRICPKQFSGSRFLEKLERPGKQSTRMPENEGSFIERVIKEIEHLPTLPQVVTKVLAMTDSDRFNAAEISREMDQSLSARVLKVANSAYFGIGAVRQVSSIHHAIVMIGLDAVKEIILTTSLFHTLRDSQKVKSLQPLWVHSLECALAAKRLAWVYRYEAMDEAYLVGLLHDIGKLIIHQYFPEQFGSIQNRNQDGVEGLDAEREILGMTHAAVAGMMAEHWNFPEAVVEAIACHHDEEWRVNPRLGRILSYADRIVSGEIDFYTAVELFRQSGMAYPANWKPEDLKKVEGILLEEIKRASSILN
jgi:putative nucleotidyltransferase with HDIG domain